MSRSIMIRGPRPAMLSMVNMDFECPSPDCDRTFGEGDWYAKAERSKSGMFRLTCRCGCRIEGTTDIRGGVVAWERE